MSVNLSKGQAISLEKPEGSDWLIYGVVDASSGKARPCTP